MRPHGATAQFGLHSHATHKAEVRAVFLGSGLPPLTVRHRPTMGLGSAVGLGSVTGPSSAVGPSSAMGPNSAMGPSALARGSQVQDVRVHQQPWGGSVVCAYRGMLRAGDSFAFCSRRRCHRPLSLSFHIGGLPAGRVSCCCELPLRGGAAVPGGRFHIAGVEGGTPCARCSAVLGLGKPSCTFQTNSVASCPLPHHLPPALTRDGSPYLHGVRPFLRRAASRRPDGLAKASTADSRSRFELASWTDRYSLGRDDRRCLYAGRTVTDTGRTAVGRVRPRGSFEEDRSVEEVPVSPRGVESSRRERARPGGRSGVDLDAGFEPKCRRREMMARSARGHVDDSSGKVHGRRWRRAAGGAAAATAADFSDNDATDGGGSEDASDVSRDGKFSGRCGEVKGGVGFFDGDSEDFKNGDDADRDAAGRGRDRGYSGDGDVVRMGKDGDGGDGTVQSVSARDHQLHSECRFPAQVHALSPARALLSTLSGISRTVCSPSPDPEPSDSSSEDDGTRARHARYLHKSKSTGKRTWPSARSQEFGPGFVFKAGAAVGVSRFPPASPEVPEFPSTSRGHVPDVARAALALADTTSGRAEAPFGDVNGEAAPTSVENHGAPSTEQSFTGMSSYGRGRGGARRRHDVGPAASASEDSILTLVGLQGPSPARSDSRDPATASNGFQVQTVSGENGGAGSTRDRLRRQVQHLCAFLEVSGQAEELVLRRSGLDGELFSPLSVAIARTPSFLSTLNLNLNVLRANGARLLATALPTQSRLKTLLLFGNQMCDDGVCAVLKSLTSAIALGGRLLELDVGGNCLTGVALRDVASYLRANTALTELGLSRNPDALPEDWAPLFEVLALPGCGLARLALEENRLGERGASLAARALASNRSLRALEAEESGLGSLAALTEVLSALQANTGSRLGYLSLDDSVERSDDARRIYRQLQRLTASRGSQVGPDPPPTARHVAAGNNAAEGGP